MATQTITKSTSFVEQRSSPVRFESIPNDDVFQTIQQASHGEVTLAGEESYTSAFGQHGIDQLVQHHVASNDVSQHGIDQLVRKHTISTNGHQQVSNASISGHEFDQLVRKHAVSTDVHQHVSNALVTGRDFDQLAQHQTITSDLHQYPINQDPNPEHIRRANQERITYRQDVAVRYLQPPTPPPPGPIIIREIRAPQAPEAPPLVIRQRPPVPATPPPVIIRERPPMPPPIEPARVVNKYLPAPPPPPRRVIIERQAPLPNKPQPIIIEKWLPYRSTGERRVIVEHAPPVVMKAASKNTIITYDAPNVDLVKNVRHLGTIRADPQSYAAQYGSQLATSDYVLNTMNRFGLGNNYTQLVEMQSRSNVSGAVTTTSAHSSTNSYAEKSINETIGNQYGYIESRSDEILYPDGHRHYHSSYSTSEQPIALN